ncbi:MAG TPA: ISNCY family transposase, partial [Rhizomicrobium sp.]|nr:ISNCY family transposase [Rhizomicrobium sp.]
MSASERERSHVMRALSKGALQQREAAERLGLGVRQVKRLLRAWRVRGDAGLISRQRGRVSPRRLEASKRARIEELLRGKYPDFGATLAAEKLREREGIEVCRESVRRIQIELGLARARRRRSARVHSPRERRPRFGELIQIDGSPHDWFEGRGPRCTLIVFIDDATGRLTALQFAPAETTKAYLSALRSHVLAHGVALAFYSDRHSIFRVNAKEAESGDGLTEFGRVAERLRIELIQAATPQAKGRVERANQTLQDRLVKEMRLRGVGDIAGAQIFAPAFIALWNAKFARPPLEAADAHRPWTKDAEALDEALARREERTLSKALTFSAGGKVYCVKTAGPGTALRGARVTLLHFQNGGMRVDYKTRSLPYTHFKTNPGPDPAADEKTLDARMADILAANSAQAQAQAV